MNSISHPDKIGEFLIGTTIGSGASSVVKKCTAEGDDKVYAVKIIPKTYVKNSTEMDRLLNEIEVLKTISHQRIQKLIAYFEDELNYYLVISYFNGTTLYNVLCRHGRLTESMAQNYIRQISNLIMYLHDNHIAHRDLKPENIIVEKSLTKLYLIDLGFALFNHGEPCTDYCGSLSYSAPEVIQRKPYDPMKADIWSLGVIYYTMLQCRLPWRVDDERLEACAIAKGEFTMLEGITQQSEKFLAGSLSVNPDKRPYVEDVLSLFFVSKVSSYPKSISLNGLSSKLYTRSVYKSDIVKSRMNY